MRVTPLSSGSQGNSLLLAAADDLLLVDIGLPIMELESRLALVDSDPREITGVLMTHRHRDHIRGVADFCRKYHTPVYGTRRTLRSLCNKLTRRLRRIEPGRPFRIGALDVHAVALSHDAPDTVGYRFDDGHHRFGMATDLGCAAGSIRDVFVRLDALLLEFNYDAAMLEGGPYPRQLRDRVASDRGHLSNAQAAALLGDLDQDRLKTLYVAHVSQRNNTPDLALTAARGALRPDVEVDVVLAEQDAPTQPFST